jgi:UDP-N-acetylmuramoyl-L-alanyl-D-glutamate--2,6-diaminopimelate ligase
MKTKSLSEIIAPVTGKVNEEYQRIMIRNITYDSRKISNGSLFVAIKGFKVDGHSYLKTTEKNGAAAAIVENKIESIKIPQIVVENSRASMAKIVKEFYTPELSQLRTVGITGTNGKTTTTYLVKSVLDSAGLSSGLIGTIEYDIAGEIISSWNTTPESSDLLDMMYSMYSKGQKGCVMEVSSHGLSLNRVDGIDFEVAVFTNLSQDHLDFHKKFEDYFSAKRRLFSLLKPNGIAVVNYDDEYGKRLINEVSRECITFGLDSDSKVYAKNWNSSLNGLSIDVATPVGDMQINSALIGQFNVENILAAIAVGLAFNFDLKTIKNGIEEVDRIPGRLEPIKLKNGRVAVVDYSHTPDALQKTLLELNKINKNNLWVVFGCGGDRDKSKRPVMGKIAEDYAIKVIVTSDNPRSENPNIIIDGILEGISIKENIIVEPDRKEAIKFALSNSESNDIILVAGKGHETYQEINGIKHPFDDRQIIEELDR